MRALTRTPDTARFPDGVQVCDSAAPDFRDVDAVVLNTGALPQGPAPFLDAAKAAGVRRVVTGSALVAADGENAAEPESGSNAAIHLDLERAVEAAVPRGRTCDRVPSPPTPFSGQPSWRPVTSSEARTPEPTGPPSMRPTSPTWPYARCSTTTSWARRSR
ncbi:hypothetical protein ACFWVU_26865 [Streptomyces sp. NPDC058686]|uniref:hypothetical protein n=1 Tax=Streptomyces sp. NPDC058686 TaxID=3346599 RepID=UPI003658B298